MVESKTSHSFGNITLEVPELTLRYCASTLTDAVTQAHTHTPVRTPIAMIDFPWSMHIQTQTSDLKVWI